MIIIVDWIYSNNITSVEREGEKLCWYGYGAVFNFAGGGATTDATGRQTTRYDRRLLGRHSDRALRRFLPRNNDGGRRYTLLERGRGPGMRGGGLLEG